MALIETIPIVITVIPCGINLIPFSIKFCRVPSMPIRSIPSLRILNAGFGEAGCYMPTHRIDMCRGPW